MRLYTLVEAGDPEAIDVYLAEEDAQRALEDCLRDEPQWDGLLHVEAVELDERHVSPTHAKGELRLVDAFSGLSAGFLALRAGSLPGGVEVVLTLCNA
jgi:hypothetical protein